MRYIVDLTPRQASQISDFINEGRYQNFGQFISTSIENQIYIEKSKISEQQPQKSKLFTLVKKEHDENGHFEVDFNVIGLTKFSGNPKLLTMPAFEDLDCSKKNLNEEFVWLWGQVNRIFPIKLGLRVLLFTLGNDQGIEIEEFRSRAADIALAYGKMIRNYERKKQKIRDEKVSAGLPMDTETLITDTNKKLRKFKKSEEVEEQYRHEEFKSRIRYMMHFLAYQNKEGKLDGAMSYLRFINLFKSNNAKNFIGITEPGLMFAKINNPIIDQKDFEKSLSEEEIDFYLDHISKNVKGEHSAIKWLLNKLSNGLEEREEINKELKKEFGQIWGASDAVFNTQRAGLMARMFELGLIEKEKDGVKVSYNISNRGRIFFEKMNRGVGDG